ncbi:hypothetical protein [Aquimonas sp.]|uniref:hypothetical protein n=1 Tax=Aquimonas sp. TaxID=1872588 RepID=UPI0037C182FC
MESVDHFHNEGPTMLSLGDFVATHVAYAVYLLTSIGLTIWVARALSSSGEMFLIRCFGQDEELARSTNRLLVIGFYLVNLGFVCYRLAGWNAGPVELVPAVGSRVGVTLLVLGGMHFFNMAMIARLGHTVNRWVRTQRQMEAADALASAAQPPELPRGFLEPRA